MSSVVDCDEIIYLSNGKIVERGTFDELMELEGDVGGKRVIRKHREDTAVLDVPDERELLDVDSREVL